MDSTAFVKEKFTVKKVWIIKYVIIKILINFDA